VKSVCKPVFPVSIQKLAVLFFSVLFTIRVSYAQTPDASVEAENGVRAGGVTIANSIAGYSGTGYVTNFTAAGDKVTVTMNILTEGFYKLMIRYYSENKTQDLYVNGYGPSAVVFPNTTVWAEADAGKYLLKPGTNTFSIQKNWGWTNIDKFSLYSVPKNNYTITPNLVNPNANTSTRALYNYLVSKFTFRMISGQTNDWYDKIKPIAGKSPLLRAFDFQHYTQGYAYLWDNANGGFKFGAEDDGQVQKAIDWYNATANQGIVSFHWHWHSPGGGTAGTNTFYTGSTTFDVTRAVIPATQENVKILQDIDAVAIQLKRLQTAGVPVLWRPLHEAGGAWFWWGAKGPAACKKLYNILFDRLTNYHGLNNLIWVWSTPEADWYPGNDSVDIIGHDSYPGVYNYDPQKSAFDRLYQITKGTKLIAMSENGPIPNPDDCLRNDAPWSYFMSWSDLVTAQNTNQHIIDVYNNPNVLTLENPTSVDKISGSNASAVTVFPNPANETVNIGGEGITHLELIDLTGRIILSSTNPTNKVNIQLFENGIYFLRIFTKHQVVQQKLIISK
jgi:mannan endo-1,4-beta-mannosidase